MDNTINKLHIRYLTDLEKYLKKIVKLTSEISIYKKEPHTCSLHNIVTSRTFNKNGRLAKVVIRTSNDNFSTDILVFILIYIFFQTSRWHRR